LLDGIFERILDASPAEVAGLTAAQTVLTQEHLHQSSIYCTLNPMNEPVRCIGYVRVSTDEQAASGAGLASQRKAIRAEAERRGWELLEIVGEDAGASSATLERDGLQSALQRLDAHEAEVLLVAKLDRMSRSVSQGAQVMDRAKRKGWSLVAIDFGLDTTTPAGEMVANVILSTAQYERRLIGQRTKDALAAKKAAGVRLGRPTTLPEVVRQRIRTEREGGQTLAAIAQGLNADDVPTARGGRKWYPSSVKAVITSLELDLPAWP
jgi:DNA invertase Pin-like site-specific DNA recombinase